MYNGRVKWIARRETAGARWSKTFSSRVVHSHTGPHPANPGLLRRCRQPYSSHSGGLHADDAPRCAQAG